MLKYATITNNGSRDVNEDSLGAYEKDGNFGFIVCDGLGGHGMGDLASQCVRDTFDDQFHKADDMVNFLGQTFITAQQILMEEQEKRRAGNKMKTTAVALVTDEKHAYICHVGDSRLYVFSKNKVKTRTIDHSIPQMLVLSKQIKEKEIRFHKDRNILLRVMGVEWEEPMYELMAPMDLKKCQAFLLCSDGFWELIEEDEMCSLLKKATTPEEWLAEMECVVKANGLGKNMDNYSAIAVWNEKE
ncbi:MAG: serine/threonine-protein phosphatase [Clostridiales bacterium]|nr:serine/threonine-protein phosphatase [Clostridiales bacterium]